MSSSSPWRPNCSGEPPPRRLPCSEVPRSWPAIVLPSNYCRSTWRGVSFSYDTHSPAARKASSKLGSGSEGAHPYFVADPDCFYRGFVADSGILQGYGPEEDLLLSGHLTRGIGEVDGASSATWTRSWTPSASRE